MGFPSDVVPDGYVVIYTPRYWHKSAQRWIYAANYGLKVFRFVVKDRNNRR